MVRCFSNRQPTTRISTASGSTGSMLFRRAGAATISVGMKRNENTAAEIAEAVRVKRLREDARRPISVNLAETIALSHALLKMADAAQRR